LAAIAAISSGQDSGCPASASTFAAASNALSFLRAFGVAGVAAPGWAAAAEASTAGAVLAFAVWAVLGLVVFFAPVLRTVFLPAIVVSPSESSISEKGGARRTARPVRTVTSTAVTPEGQPVQIPRDFADGVTSAATRGALRREASFLEPRPHEASSFLGGAQLDPLLHAGRSLYLVPDGPAAEPGYAVLAAALVQRGRWALGRMVLGGHRQVVLVRPAGAALILHVLHYPEHVRARHPAALPRPEAASEELRLAGLLIDAAGGAVDWGAYRDEAARELRALLDAKVRGQPAAAPEPARMVLPLLEALHQSVAAAQADDGAAPRGKARAPRRRTRRTA